MAEYASKLTYRLLLANVYAAAWVARLEGHEDDSTLLSKFLNLHDYLLKSMERERAGIFDAVDPGFLVSVIRGWIRMYGAGLDELRGRHPRTQQSDDLRANGVNWSQKLAISYEGLMGIGSPSRYAEFWAERSLKDRTIYESFEERMRFIGTEGYLAVAELVRRDELLVLDDGPNAIPSYDLLVAVGRAGDGANIREVFESERWHVMRLEEQAECVLRRCRLK